MKLRDNSQKENSLFHYFVFLLTGSRESSVAAYPYVDFIGGFNKGQDELNLKIMQVDGRWQFDDSLHGGDPKSLYNLSSSPVVLENSRLKILRVRFKTRGGEWKIAIPKDTRELGDYALNATGEPEVYDKLGVRLHFYPTPDYSVTNGVEVLYQRASDHFDATDENVEPGFPQVFHRYPAAVSAEEYALANGMQNRMSFIKNEMAELDSLVSEHYSGRDMDDQPAFGIETSLRANALQNNSMGSALNPPM